MLLQESAVRSCQIHANNFYRDYLHDSRPSRFPAMSRVHTKTIKRIITLGPEGQSVAISDNGKITNR
ncbi:protein of unknown function [Magnetospirillum sp. XM-1]|nr:protein of unknown function [Magnetospirillum sp. XM-1]